jgi:hypothetical protein
MAARGGHRNNSYAGVAQLVERNLAKVEVESSRLFSRSRIRQREAARLPFLLMRQAIFWFFSALREFQALARPFR